MTKGLSIFLVLFFLVFPSAIAAQANSPETLDVSYEDVNPNNNFSYGVKRIKEKILLNIFSFSKNKQSDYMRKLVNIRLVELKYVVDHNEMGTFENATKRYFTSAGQYTAFLSKYDLTDKKNDFAKELEKHIPVLEKLRDKYNPAIAEWRFLHDDINYAKIYLSKLRE